MYTYAKAKAREMKLARTISQDRDCLLVNKQTFTLADLQLGIKGLYKALYIQLFTKVLLLNINVVGCIKIGTTAALPKLFLDQLVDQLSELGVGFSFLTYPKNKLSNQGEQLFN